MPRPESVFRNYLDVLGIGAVETDLAGLRRIVRRHLLTVPFENVSKRLQAARGERTVPGLAAYLEGIRRHRFGGTCYANNHALYRLLQHLGFEIRLCGGDMADRRDVHIAMIVTCEGRDYIVDCGFAAPFFEPLPADLTDPRVIAFGDERYVIQPRDHEGRLRVDCHAGGEWRYGYLLKPEHREWRNFEPIVAASYAPDAHFMNALWIVRFNEQGSVALRDRRLTRVIGGRSTTTEIADDDMPGAAQEIFGISADFVRGAIGNRRLPASS